MPVKVGMVSLGCPKNQIDAEIMLDKLKQGGYSLVSDAGMADVAIVNTCGFIKDAKEEAIAEILELANLKKEGRIKSIVVTGCLAQRYKEEILAELSEVDAVVAIGKNAEICEIVDRSLKEKGVLYDAPQSDLPLNGGRILTTPSYLAYLKIAEGCDNNCSYCAIPMIRGGFRSRTTGDILSEAKTLAQNGVRELVLVAQDTTRYGLDIYGERVLPKLCEELCKIEGIEWIRLLYCYPNGISDELLDVIAQNEKMVEYLDIPLQHCSSEVLNKMNRSGDEQSLAALMQKIRNKIPNIVLRTTVMVGFPGESEEDFTKLSQFIHDVGFDRLGCFAFSPEEGTKAYEMENQMDEETKQKRQEIIMEQQMEISAQKLDTWQGRTLSVLVEGYDKYAGVFFGRSRYDAPEIDGKIFFTSDKKQTIGSFANVLINDTLDYDLLGEA